MNSETINTTGLITGGNCTITGAMNSETINTTGLITGGNCTITGAMNTDLVEPSNLENTFNLCSTQTVQLNIGTASERTDAINIGTSSGAINIGTLTASGTIQAITIGSTTADANQTITFNRPLTCKSIDTQNSNISCGGGTITGSTITVDNISSKTGDTISIPSNIDMGTRNITSGIVICNGIGIYNNTNTRGNINAGTGNITGGQILSPLYNSSDPGIDLSIGSTLIEGKLTIGGANSRTGAINIGTGTNNSGAIDIGTNSGAINIGTLTASGTIQAITIGSTTADANQTITFNRPITTNNNAINAGLSTITVGSIKPSYTSVPEYMRDGTISTLNYIGGQVKYSPSVNVGIPSGSNNVTTICSSGQTINEGVYLFTYFIKFRVTNGGNVNLGTYKIGITTSESNLGFAFIYMSDLLANKTIFDSYTTFSQSYCFQNTEPNTFYLTSTLQYSGTSNTIYCNHETNMTITRIA
jgi:hypothetical protein